MTYGRLLLGATPLGQPSDASPRLIDALGNADVVAAEDTRRVRTLAKALDVAITGRVVSLFDQVEAARVPALVDEIEAGATVLLVSDAGMPLISDPGYRLVVACVEAGLPVTCLPGPSAVTTALAVSGLPSEKFCFEGFAPRKSGGAQNVAGLAGRRAAHLRVLRVAAPVGGVPARCRRGARRRAPRGGLPGADQGARGGGARVARGAGGVGGRRRARRDHRRAGGRDARPPTYRPWWHKCRTSSPRGRVSRMPARRWPRPIRGCGRASCTTRSCSRAARTNRPRLPPRDTAARRRERPCAGIPPIRRRERNRR